MTVAELRTILGHIQQLYLVAGAKAQAKDLQAIADILRPHANTPLDRFVADLRARLDGGGDKRKPRSRPTGIAATAKIPRIPRIAKSAALNESAIAAHVARLRAAGTHQPAFDAALAAINADTSLKVADVAEIARQYASSVTKYRTLDAARKDIAAAFVRRARFENKLR